LKNLFAEAGKSKDLRLPLAAIELPLGIHFMKKTHIVILIGIAALIVGLLVYSVDFSTYDSIQSAKQKEGKFVHIIARLDKNSPIEYDPVNNPNYFAFTAVDSLGGSTKVIYHNSKPTDIEKSERIVLQGSMQKDHFECKKILLKCPSKYKDDKQQMQKNIQESTTNS
jgi:cytochrome c-type biogenesis protein CcmE